MYRYIHTYLYIERDTYYMCYIYDGRRDRKREGDGRGASVRAFSLYKYISISI